MGTKEARNDTLTFQKDSDWATTKDWEQLYKPTITTNTINFSNLSTRRFKALQNRYTIDLLRLNLRNKCAGINYNKYGKKLGNTFEPLTDIFCDNFIIGMPISLDFLKNNNEEEEEEEEEEEDQTDARIYKHMGTANEQVRKMLKQHGLPEVTSVKGVRINKRVYDIDDPLANMVHLRNGKKEKYKIQCIKVSTADIPIEKVIAFLENKTARQKFGVVLLDIDFTIDHSGSFNRHELIHFLVNKHDFRMQNCFNKEENMYNGSYRHGKNDRPTILNNAHHVGLNCVTWIYTKDGFTIRSKAYNKFAQTLETKSVRKSFGNHWRDWVVQDNNLLATARDGGKDKGLTRMETTLYIDEQKDLNVKFDIKLLMKELLSISTLFDSSVVWTTPYASQWKAYTEKMEHTLVVINKNENVAQFGYQHNELTNNVAGVETKNISTRMDWCLGNLSLDQTLPVDIISYEFNIGTKSVTVEHKSLQKFWNGRDNTNFGMEKTNTDNKKVDHTVLLYKEIPPTGTRMVGHFGPYSCYENSITPDYNQLRLNDLGFVPTPQCTMHLPTKKATGKSKCYWSFLGLKNIPNIQLPAIATKQRILTKKEIIISVEDLVSADTKKELTRELDKKARTHLITKNIKRWRDILYRFGDYKDLKFKKLTDLNVLSTYSIRACVPLKTTFGPTWKVVLGTCLDIDYPKTENIHCVWANKKLANYLTDLFPTANCTLIKKEYRPKNLKIKITGVGSYNGHRCAYIHLFNNEPVENNFDNVVVEEVNNPSKLPTADVDSHFPYNSLGNMCVEFGIGDTIVPVFKYKIQWHGDEKLVLRLKDQTKDYLAGMFLESVEDQLLTGCSFRLTKNRRNPHTKKHYMEGVVVQNNEWWLRIPEDKITCISVCPDDTHVLSSYKKLISGVVLVLLSNNTIHKAKVGSKVFKSVGGVRKK